MTPFPPSDQVQFLLQGDAWITQVIINSYGVSFVFANGCQVDASAAISYTDEHGVETIHDREWFDERAIFFHRLLETPLHGVVTDGLAMTLTFEGGRRLIVYSDLQPYEAGAVLGPNNTGFYF